MPRLCRFPHLRWGIKRLFHLHYQKYIDELRQKYIKNPPEGMTPKLIRNMTDSDLLDMHYFLTEDDDLDDDTFEEGFYIDFF